MVVEKSNATLIKYYYYSFNTFTNTIIHLLIIYGKIWGEKCIFFCWHDSGSGGGQ